MTYRITYTSRAEADIREAMEWWRDHRSHEQAARWIEQIFPSIETLERDPDRFPAAPETDLHPSGIRQLLFGIGRSITHRVLFAIDGDEVSILAVRHIACRDLRADDLWG
ncbi:MAG TPA: type II toxin-antitoxin system RelE/ParE family toxin [Caulifigura sp.]|jgi:plasmid stabilization system protein ParE|nr:type II toxin-antitoxin system RelE/ParE family toxin [Caulifigura sp.]